MVSFSHIDKALKLAWIKRLMDEKQSSWKVVANEALIKYLHSAYKTI
jgi:hypothetical protein